MVGNGLTDYRYDNIWGLIDMSFWYGVLGTRTYMNMTANCRKDNCPSYCDALFMDFAEVLEKINRFDIFGKCWTGPS